MKFLRLPFTFKRFERWGRNVFFVKKIFYTLVILSFSAAFATYLTFSHGLFLGTSKVNYAYNLIVMDAVLLVLLALITAYRIVKIFYRRRKGTAGAQFHSRLVLIFSLLSITPTVIVSIFSSTLFEIGAQPWFDRPTKFIIDKFIDVAETYIREVELQLRDDGVSIIQEMTPQINNIYDSQETFSRWLTDIVTKRGMREAIILDSEGRVWAKTPLTFSLELEHISYDLWQKASKGTIITVSNSPQNRIRSLIRMHPTLDLYLFVGRTSIQEVLEYISYAKKYRDEYLQLDEKRWSMRSVFLIIYGLVALLTVIIAVGLGIFLADYISKPIAELVFAAQRIRRGNLSTRVKIKNNVMEFLGLAKAFNHMMEEIQKQRQSLIETNKDLAERRKFISATLSGVSSGVIALNTEKRIEIINTQACTLLSIDQESAVGEKFSSIFPDFDKQLVDIWDHNDPHMCQVSIREKHEILSLMVKINKVDNSDISYVVTFDNYTELHQAQKKAAWGDVARRVAHEIKNPLTPIHLSAEMLKRKLRGKLSDEDMAHVETTTKTILRHVEDIERIVREFSQLSRMPSPILKKVDLIELIKISVSLQKEAYPDVHFFEKYPNADVIIDADENLLSQAFTNILKNSVDILKEANQHGKDKLVYITCQTHLKNVTITFEDNGKGFPENMKDKLLEPYVTTRPTGTGLGLAITQKIVEDHNGTIALYNRPEGGAKVELLIPKS